MALSASVSVVSSVWASKHWWPDMRLVAITLFVCCFAVLALVNEAAGEPIAAQYLPSPLNLVTLWACGVAILCIRDPLVQFLCLAWTAWAPVGNLFILGQHLIPNLLDPDSTRGIPKAAMI